MGITQNVKSNFSNKTDFVVDMGFGFEENYCKAIGVSTTLYLLYRLGVEIYKSSDMQMLFETVKTINYIFDKTSKLIESKTLKFENDYQKLCWISNYTQMGIAMEAALKTSEMMWTNSIYTGCDEFLHGFESCLNKNDLYFIIDFDQKNEFADSTWLFLKKQNVQVINLEKVLPLPNGWNNSNNFFINLLVLIMVQLILDYLRSTYKIEMKDIPRFKNVTEITKLK